MDRPLPTPLLVALAALGIILLGGLLFWSYRRIEGPIVETGKPPADYFQRPAVAGEGSR
ncbi:MAG: hypothetical protein LDL55_09445 [Armatimonadetes bacterium]|jgi:hypothetical protein|nr:hypothetical protein [Armatimonadota bacterium]